MPLKSEVDPDNNNDVKISFDNYLKDRDQLDNFIEEYKKKYADKNKVPRPNYWSGWNLSPSSIEFWLDGDNRIHERLKYTKNSKGEWIRSLLSP